MPGLDRRSIIALCTLLAASPGCGLGLIGGPSVATVRFFAAHAGTPGEDGYPDYGDEQTTRVFMNDMGWQIALSEVFVTTAEVQFVLCQDESGTPIEMFWGPCPESFVSTNDLESVPLGAVTVDDGNYCSIDVVFGPFVPPPGADDHVAVGNPMIEGNTLVVVGVARRGMPGMQEEVPFSVVSDVEITARLDVSTFQNGGPIKLANENFPRDLTLIKTYDRFFDGLDFATATPADIEAAVIAALETETVVFDGTYD
jgi:hypothetical protein